MLEVSNLLARMVPALHYPHHSSVSCFLECGFKRSFHGPIKVRHETLTVLEVPSHSCGGPKIGGPLGNGLEDVTSGCNQFGISLRCVHFRLNNPIRWVQRDLILWFRKSLKVVCVDGIAHGGSVPSFSMILTVLLLCSTQSFRTSWSLFGLFLAGVIDCTI